MATKWRRGDSWYINYAADGEQVRRSLGRVTESQAEKIRRRIELELAHGATLLLPKRAPLFQEFAVDYLAWYEHEHPASFDRTEQIFRCHLLPEFGLKALDEIEARHAEQYKADRRRPDTSVEPPRAPASATIIKELRALKAALNRAVEWEVLDRSQIAKVKEPKDLNSRPPRWFSEKELQAIYQATAFPAYRQAWKLLANTGLRRAEALQLHEKHRGQDRLLIESTEGARTKSGKWREVPLNDQAAAALDSMVLHDGFYIPRMHPENFSRAFRRIAQATGVGGSLHHLRHTYCSHLVMAGVPLRTVQILAGHAHSSTTEKYAHLAPDHLAGAADKIAL